MDENKTSLIEKVSKTSTKFFGSWWAVVMHSLLLVVWFGLGLSLEIFMLWISLEAIFIWVVYLAASSRREEQRDKMDTWQQLKIKEKMLDSLSNEEKHSHKLEQILKILYELQEEVKTLRGESSSEAAGGVKSLKNSKKK